MSVPQTVAEVLSKHVVLEVESIDRMYLNVYVPQLQAVEGTLKFIRIHRGHKVASTHVVEPITRQFVSSIERFANNAKLCLNGHEYLKQQLKQRGIAYQPLENGILSCQHPQALQPLCDRLSEGKIEALLRKWLRRLPHPFTARDRQAGYRYQLSILQLELSLTQILDRPVSGRIFFEDVIRENLDIGRPKQIQLIFDRPIIKTTPGPFRTRVITDGVIPSLHIAYKGTRI